jgi:dihydropteroate synthase
MPVATTWRFGVDTADISRGLLMGIVNATPDSFSGDGFGDDLDSALEYGVRLHEQGADLVDVGGESTRPGAGGVSATEELSRVSAVVTGLVHEGVAVSIDTSKPEVAEKALSLGAVVVNDVRACLEPGMIELVAGSGCGVVLMHMKGTPASMADDPIYDDVVGEVEQFLLRRVDALVAAGGDPQRIAIDPGIGFAKTAEHNLTILASIARLSSHGIPLVLGASRKRFLRTFVGPGGVQDLDAATATIAALGFAEGARVFRVHDVVASHRALSLAAAIVRRQQWDEWSLDSNRGDSPG